MIRSLRRKFIITAMLSVFAVLLLIMGSINIVNYRNVVRSAGIRMDFLANGAVPLPFEGEAPKDEAPGGQSPEGETRDAKDRQGDPDENKGKMEPQNDFFRFGRNGLSAEAQYDSRYFTVLFNAAGKATAVNTGKIAAVDTAEAEEMAQTLYDKGKTTGFLDSYRYRAEETDNGIRYTFLDCSRELDTFYSFLTASVVVSLFGMLLIFLLILFFSKMALRPAQESYEKQKRFITDASHEIKTPLAVISAATEVVELDAGESEWTQSIRHQIERLTSLTEKLVMLSRMDEESYRPEMREFSLSDTARETAESFLPVAAERNRQYEIAVEEGIDYTGDPDGIRQVISLLIDNAMKYANDGGTVRVSLKKAGKNRVLTVFNTVDGIEKGDHKEFFERFYRADQSRNSAGGHGIGLSVAEAIVQQHKGKITAESKDEKSIEFRVVL